MSTLRYNGIELKLTETNEFRSTPEYSRDGKDIVAVKYRLDVTGVFAPHATSYALVASGGELAALPSAGQRPAMTWRAVHDLLSAPRGRLEFYYGDRLMLGAPRGGKGGDIDADAGPFVRSLNVVPMGETQTFLVRIVLEATVDECSAESTSANLDPLASNRWSCTHQVDQLHFTTISTTGEAAFRLDSLSVLRHPADHYRDLVLPAIPIGFRREALKVEVDTTGRYLRYAVIDQEMPYSLGDRNNLNFGTPASLGVQKFEAVTVLGVPPMVKGDVAIAGPMTTMSIEVRAWGDAKSSRANLLLFCTKLAVERLVIKAGKLPPGGSMVKSIQVIELFHEQTVGLRVETWRNVAKPGDAQALGLGTIFAELVGIDQLPDTFPADAKNGLPGGYLPQLPGPANGRGTYLGKILTQKFQDACSEVYRNNGCDTDIRLEPPQYSCDSLLYPDVTGGPPVKNPNKYRNVDKGIGTEYAVKRAVKTTHNRRAMVASGRIPTPPATPDPGSPGLRDAGQVPAPQDDPDLDDLEILTLARPMTRVTVEWTAERIGAKPILPAPIDPSGKLVLLDSQVEPEMAELFSDGQTVVYRVSGRYDYVARRHIDLTRESLFMGISPFADIDREAATLYPDSYDPSILYPASPNGSPGSAPGISSDPDAGLAQDPAGLAYESPPTGSGTGTGYPVVSGLA